MRLYVHVSTYFKVIHPEVLPIQAEKVRDREIDKRVKRSGNIESVEMEVKERQQRLNQLGEELVRLGAMSPLVAAKAELVTRKVKEEQVLLERAKRAMADSENKLRWPDYYLIHYRIYQCEWQHLRKEHCIVEKVTPSNV